MYPRNFTGSISVSIECPEVISVIIKVQQNSGFQSEISGYKFGIELVIFHAKFRTFISYIRHVYLH